MYPLISFSKNKYREEKTNSTVTKTRLTSNHSNSKESSSVILTSINRCHFNESVSLS